MIDTRYIQKHFEELLFFKCFFAVCFRLLLKLFWGSSAEKVFEWEHVVFGIQILTILQVMSSWMIPYSAVQQPLESIITKNFYKHSTKDLKPTWKLTQSFVRLNNLLCN